MVAATCFDFSFPDGSGLHAEFSPGLPEEMKLPQFAVKCFADCATPDDFKVRLRSLAEECNQSLMIVSEA